MQSHDYVPGVSGWKIDENGRLELNDGNRRVIAKMLMVTTAGPGMTNDQAQASITESLREEVAGGCSEERSDTPFAVKGDQVILTQAFIDAGKLSPVLGVRTSVNAAGQAVFAGIGAGLCCMCEGGDTSTPGDKEVKAEVKTDFAGGFTNSSDKLCAAISETDLSESLKNFNLGDFLSGLKKDIVTRDDAQEKVAVTIGGVNYIKQSLIKGEAARLVADEIIAACSAAKQ